MVIDALESIGKVVKEMSQFRNVYEVVSKIALEPKEIFNSEEMINVSRKSISEAIEYLQKVLDHLNSYFPSDPIQK